MTQSTSDKQAKLAEALRANLKRRKAQHRARKTAHTLSETPASSSQVQNHRPAQTRATPKSLSTEIKEP